jgi:hypothetical protein
MEQSWVLLKRSNSKKLIVTIFLLTVITMAILELWQPGTMALIISGVAAGVVHVNSCIRSIMSSIGEILSYIGECLH